MEKEKRMKTLGRRCRILGFVWIYGALSLIAIGSLGTLLFQGFREFLWLFSPFNFANYLTIMLILVPGGGLLWLSEKLDKSN